MQTMTIPGVPSIDTIHIVGITPNYDCDGYGEGIHKFPIRWDDYRHWQKLESGSRERTEFNRMLILRAVQEDVLELGRTQVSETYLLTEQEFMKLYWDDMDGFDRNYWITHGYHCWFDLRR